MIAKQRILCALLAFVAMSAQGMNLLRPYDSLIRPSYNNDHRIQLLFVGEAGISDKGWSDDCRTNVLRIWNPDQDALSMLDGFPDNTPIGQKRIELDANDDGVRGHFCVDGRLRNKFSAYAGARAFFRENWSISAYVPFYSMELDRVCWKDQTKNVSDEDARVKELLTDDFFANVCELGDGLDLTGWNRTGVGDVVLMLEWFHDFPQAKQILKNVRINWRGGVGLPTGLRRDEDKLFAIPYGYDGAFSLPFGIGIDLHFDFFVRAGFDVQLTHIFGNTRCRRIKTNECQTDLLLLEKMEVYKDFGLTQQFNLYAQLYKPYKGFSFLLGYQYLKQGKDEIALCGGAPFCGPVANNAEHLKDWTVHQIVVRVDYDIGDHFDDPIIYPRASFYAQLPFNGKRVAVTSNLGFSLSFDF